MTNYYADIPDYLDFQNISFHPREWSCVFLDVCKRSTSQKSIEILEFGSGCSGFPTWLRNMVRSHHINADVYVTCQDVTYANSSHLSSVANEVVIGPISEKLGLSRFDIIFSTQVLEHVVNPVYLLENLFKLLRHDGVLYLFAPRYDFPFYLSPSARDLGLISYILTSVRLSWIRLITRLIRSPSFVVDTSPCCLREPFRIDNDAMHWVSLHDVRLFAHRYGFLTTSIDSSLGARFLTKQWFIDTFCKLSIAVHRPACYLYDQK